MPRFMLDTDISSCIMKRTNKNVAKKIQTVPVSDVCISAINRAELLFGVVRSPRRAKDQAALDDFLMYISVLDYPGAAAGDYADIRNHLESRGTPIGANDMLIASHARFLGITLVTNNTREFSRVPGLTVENWV